MGDIPDKVPLPDMFQVDNGCVSERSPIKGKTAVRNDRKACRSGSRFWIRLGKANQELVNIKLSIVKESSGPIYHCFYILVLDI